MNFKFLADSPWKSKREPISNSPSPSPFFRSPYSKAQANSDRFIPCRIHDSASGMLIQSTEEAPQPLPSNTSPNNGQQMIEEPSPLQNRYSALLEAHIISDFDVSNLEPQEKFSASNTPYKTNPNILKYKKLKKSLSENSMNSNGYSPFQTTSFEPPKINVKRQISKLPYKILDVPSLADDFYLNLLDWSSSNNIAVGLGNFVCMWSAATNKAYKIHKAAADYTIASVAWSQGSTNLAVGESDGTIKLYDVETCKLIRDLEGHSCRAGSLAWNGNLLASGSRDRTILVRDIRSSDDYLHKFRGHKQEICGLKWSPDFKYLASGGNDNKIIVWDSKNRNEMVRFSEHQAAVKALAWNPETPHVLASGGGKNDRCIKFWNMHTHKRLGSIDTGSQVCNMVFSKNSNELVSSHGYSLNEVVVWNYPSMEKVASLTGHTSRVLYLCMSPDGENVITGAGDETLRFWNVFPPHSKQNSDIFDHSAVFPSSVDLR